MTKRVVFIMMICCFFTAGSAFCQTGLPNTNPNAEHDRLHALLVRSETITLPDSVITKLQDHAAKNHMVLRDVMKYSVFLKILYNPEITDAEKLDACDFGLRAYAPTNLLPAAIFNQFIRTHQAAKN